MAYTIAFYNQKGGVGKTATAIHTGEALSKMNTRTLLVDLDPNRNTSRPFCEDYEYSLLDVLSNREFDPQKAIYTARSNLDILPSHISLAVLQSTIGGQVHKEKKMKKQLEKIESNYEVILLDLPATMCDLSLNGVYAADMICIVLSYERDAVEGIKDLFRFVSEIKETQDFDYMILRNGMDARKTTAIEFINVQVSKFLDHGKVFKTVIRRDETINRAKIENQTLFTFSPKCPTITDYMRFAEEIKELEKNA